MAVTISGTTGVGVSTTPLYPSDIAVGTLGTTANSQLVGARLLGVAGTNGDTLEISQLRGTAGTDWTTAGWRLQQRVDGTWMGYIQFNGTASGTNSNGISFGTGSSTVNANSVTERLRIDSSGNVGIANPTPLGRLDIGGQTASNVQAVLTRGVSDSNFQIRAINGASGATPGTLVGEFGLVYAGTGDAATINFYRGAGTQDASLGINTNNVERLKIDSSGRVTMPAQPAFLANHSLSTATTPSEIIWSAAVNINIGSCYSSTTGRFTAPVAGTYFFRTHILTSNAPAGETRVALCKNGVAYGGATTILVKPANTWATVIVTSHMYLAVGDYASVILVQLPASGALHNDANFNSFSGHLVG